MYLHNGPRPEKSDIWPKGVSHEEGGKTKVILPPLGGSRLAWQMRAWRRRVEVEIGHKQTALIYEWQVVKG